MNVTYTYLNYLPGGCGNFLSRALNLIDNSHCWVDSTSNTLPTSVDKKFDLFNYRSQHDRHLKDMPYNWVKFESSLKRYWLTRPHHSVPDGSLSIMPVHFTHDPSAQNIAGPDDKEKYVQITTSDPKVYEWMHMNALFKNCTLGAAWMELYASWHSRPDVLFVQLEDLFEWDTFEPCYKNICDHLEINKERIHLDYVKTLHSQWVKTTLPMEKIPEYKKKIGWIL